MDKLRAMQTFVRIVEANSFSKAAETLGLPRASLTTIIQQLEDFLGKQLLQRTTRRLSLTAEGAEYYEKCLEILAAVEAAELPFREADAGTPRGTLRVDLPGALGRNVVVPRLADFRRRYPDIRLVLSFSDRLVDITQEGVDCVLRVGQLQDSSMIGREIGSMRFVTCAAPSYLERYGMPQDLEDLKNHRGIIHFSGRTGRPFEWDFLKEGASTRIQIDGDVAVNDADAYVSCALQGLGLVQAARYQAERYMEQGQLVPVLPEYSPAPMPISLVYPKGRLATPKLGVFAGWIRTLFDDLPSLSR